MKAVMSEHAAFARCLNRRGPPGRPGCSAGSSIIRDARGKTIALVLCAPLDVAHAAHWPTLAAAHDRVSMGWAGGCQADSMPDLGRLSAQLKDPKASLAMGVVDGFKVKSFGPECLGKSVTIKYDNPQGREIQYNQVGPWLDRHKWTSTPRDVIDSMPSLGGLLGKLESLYEEHIHLFMEGWPEDVRAHLLQP